MALAAMAAAIGVPPLVIRRHEVVHGLATLAMLGPGTVALALLVVALGVLARAFQAFAAYRLVGLDPRPGDMLRLSAASYATNKVVKSGGAAGLLPYAGDARRRAHGVAPVVGAYACMQTAATVAMSALVAAALAVGWSSGALHGIALGGAVAGLACTVAVVAAVLLIGSRASSVDALVVGAHRASARLRRNAGPAPREGGAVVAGAIARLRCDRHGTAMLVGAAIAGKVVGAAGLIVIVHGCGAPIGMATLVLVYALTLLSAVAGPLPAGAGTTDAALGVLLVTFGATAATAAGAVIAFRVVDVWLPLAIGGLASIRCRRLASRHTAVDGLVVVPDRHARAA